LKGAVAQVARIFWGRDDEKKVGSGEGRPNWADSVAPTTAYYSWTTAAASQSAADQLVVAAQVFRKTLLFNAAVDIHFSIFVFCTIQLSIGANCWT
jgi:hypothetical protein